MHGAAASLGNVYEPYLGFTTDLGTLAWVLVTGHNLAESYYAAQPVLSWMSVLVGDPLYRPYARLTDPAGLPSTKWTDFRRIILAHKGSVLEAAADLTRRAREKHESLYLEALGAAQYDAGDLARAEGSFKAAASLTKDPKIAFRLLLEQVRTLEKLGNKMKAVSMLSKALEAKSALTG
jgi:tetratricopeptide (TPR) repeat protein